MEDISINEKEVEKQEKVNASAEGQKSQQAPTEEAAVPTTPEEKPKKKNKGLIAALVVLLILAIGGGVTAVILNNNKNNDSSNDQKNNEKETKEDLPKENQNRLTGNELSDFDLQFLKLENEEKNKTYSPLSIKYALAMLKEGAEGESEAQIENLIGDYNPKAYLNSENRSLANALFIKESYKEDILDSYIKTLDEKYNASVIYDPFIDATNINKWVSDQTLGIIDKLLDDTAVQQSTFTLINALAIDMNWNYEIQCRENGKVPCYYKDHPTKMILHENYQLPYVGRLSQYKEYETITFDNKDEVRAGEIGASINNYDIVKELGEENMRNTIKTEYEKWLKSDEVVNWKKDHSDWTPTEDADKIATQFIEEVNTNYGHTFQTTDFYFDDNENEKVFAKDLKEYDGSTLQYVGIMPKNDSLKEYVEKADAKQISAIVNGLKSIRKEDVKEKAVTIIKGSIPFFNYDYDLELKKDLQSLGVENVFKGDGSASLSKLADPSDDVMIKDAVHKAKIEFSNDGIRAAAATAFIGGLGHAAGGQPFFTYSWDVPIEEIDLAFDKPYMYLIRDKVTGEVWFVGTVYEPTKAEQQQ